MVALTPVAFEACRRAGLHPTVLDDHVQRPDFYLRPEPYIRWQLDWLRRLDQAIGGDGTVLACAQLITVPITSVVVAARMLSGAVDSTAPDGVRYVGETGPEEESGYHNGHLQFWPLLGDQPLAARLLPVISDLRGLSYDTRSTIEDHPSTISEGRPILRQLRARFGQAVGPYRRARFGSPLRHRGGTTLMLWYAGYGARRFDSDERRSGRRTVFFARGGDSARLMDPTLPPRRPGGIPVDFSLPSAPPLSGSLADLLNEVDEWTQVTGAARILRRRLATFVHVICPVVARASVVIEAEYDRFGVDKVAAANSSSLEEFACLIAAGRKGIHRTLLQHGDHLFSYSSWLVNDTQNFDELAASDPTIGSSLEVAAREIGARAPSVTMYAPRINDLEARRTKISSRPAEHADIVCYVPCMLTGDSNAIGGSYFDDSWYHRWHLRLLNVMAARPGQRFIWKGLPAADQAVDPIPDLIYERGVSNVTYESRPFLSIVNDIDRVLLDFPSTALYEAAHLGIPVLALSFSRFAALRAPAAAMFASVLRVCDTEEQGIRHLEDFLDDDPERWIVDLSALTEHAV